MCNCYSIMNHGASIRARRKNLWTPLHFAPWTGKPDVVRLLLESGADLEALSDVYNTLALSIQISVDFKCVCSMLKDALYGGSCPAPRVADRGAKVRQILMDDGSKKVQTVQ